MIYNLAKEFTPTPFGRYISDGPKSAEKFRSILIPLLNECHKKNETLTIDLDDVPIGIGSSFLEETFGGVIREKEFNEHQLSEILIIKSNEDKSYIDEIREYIREAQKVINQ
ncbi:STAS-like domain-containing protein [Psychromonas sp. psych-6C06]|uniref:STAS-like domain-containing protein n=1 Tax=Psychromonas sp. psych-6C06 TaxID=2058089 RepID=UPI00187D082B|nr:STAS-like domain-containing protein [Psychromonas sp. psych-6C06]